MKGIRKTYAAPQIQAKALKPTMVRGVLATLGDGRLIAVTPPRCAARSSPDWTTRKLGTVMAICG
jgi:hypothetical protein